MHAMQKYSTLFPHALQASLTSSCCCRVDDVHMNVVVLTNLAREHLEEGERMDDYVSTAASLFSRLEDPDTQRAVINVDGAAHG